MIAAPAEAVTKQIFYNYLNNFLLIVKLCASRLNSRKIDCYGFFAERTGRI